MLLLFDIDGTMISTGGLGMRAMVAAGREMFGAGWTGEGVSFAGRLDPLIVADLVAQSGVRATEEALTEFRSAYARELESLLTQQPGRVLEGVTELLDRLERWDEPSPTLGVLTGNYATTGRMKLSRCGIDPDRFALAVWGDESVKRPPRRADLVEIAMERWGARRGRATKGEEVVVIGDTPGDVECGKAHGCRVLAVATGKYTRVELEEHGPDMAVETLGDTERLASWLMGKS
jgi:phosphoglycolate phosphatase-like HAD superfamily hydrolase